VDAPELLRNAEAALTAALRQRSPFAIYSAGIRATDRPACGTSPDTIVDALNGRRLALELRPVADAQARTTAFLRGRVGLRTPEGRNGPAGDIATAAERAGLSTLLDARMLELAADRLAAHPDERIAIEISSRTLHDPQWLPMLAAHLGARPGIESRLIVAIPEVALQKLPATRGRLDAMKALGIGIALSGFGTGYATGKHLRGLPLDLVEIAGPFVQTAQRSTDDRLLLRTLVDLAQHVGIATVAPWVEDDETARLLAAWGVDYLEDTSDESIRTDGHEAPGADRTRRTA
jgi:EAL domain-containing protein (putative c-di-GMP-specific phosphodiesterase class I)